MDQLKFYKYAIIALVVLNVGLLVSILISPSLTRHRFGPPPQNFKSELAEILNLDENQVIVFEKLADDHNRKLQSIKSEQQDLILPYFDSLIDSTVVIDEDSTFTIYQKLEQEKLKVTYDHLLDIQDLIDQNQMKNYKKFINAFKDKVLLKRRNHTRPPHK
ncbi:MAG: hypothetical protein AAGA77_09090 [Bacteroidota bacterium]